MSGDRSISVPLRRPGHGQGMAASDLAELVYDELLKRARQAMLHERVGHTLQPTALVHEVYERLVDQTRVDWQGRSHFMAIAAKQIRRILVDHARRKAAVKHGGKLRRVLLENLTENRVGPSLELLSLEDALRRLTEEDERAARVVELRFYGGLSEPEVAACLGVSERTVRNDWSFARVWLRRQMGVDSA